VRHTSSRRKEFCTSREFYAGSGEMTLSGFVLPIGGVWSVWCPVEMNAER
jgi:hypothetical protein